MKSLCIVLLVTKGYSLSFLQAHSLTTEYSTSGSQKAVYLLASIGWQLKNGSVSLTRAIAASTLSTQLVLANILIKAVDMASLVNSSASERLLIIVAMIGPYLLGMPRMFLLPYILGKPGHTANDLRVLSLYKPPKSSSGKSPKPRKFRLTHFTICFDGWYSFMHSLQLQSSKVI